MQLAIIQKRKYWYWISALTFGLGLVSLALFGLKLGIDFTGGTLLEVEFNQPPDVNAVREALKRVDAEATVPGSETVPSDESGLIPLAWAQEAEPSAGPVIPETTDSAVPTPVVPPSTDETVAEAPESLHEDVANAILQQSGERGLLLRMPYIDNETHNAILKELAVVNGGEPVKELRYETIGPVISDTLKKNSLISIALAALCIIMYIAFAFRKMPKHIVRSWKFGVVAVVALVHDVMIVVGIFSILGWTMGVEIDSLFVTALLTVMGFSVHDTIVVFDRIRENLLRGRGRDLAEIANESVNQTMARSINTSLTTLITLFALLVFGGESIRYFTLALIIGISVGTYSSIFVASPLIVDWKTDRKSKD